MPRPRKDLPSVPRIVRVAADEQHPPWYAEIGYSAYREGKRLATPPPRRTKRPHRLTVNVPQVRLCSARYALCLGAAVLKGQGVVCTAPGDPVRSVSFVCPQHLQGPGLTSAVERGLRDLTAGHPVPVTPPAKGKVVSIRLSPEAAWQLAQLVGSSKRSPWLRAALSLGRGEENP